MAKTPKNSATAPVASNTTAVQPQNDAGVTTSPESTPSGSNGPDGTNTGPADADGSVADQKQNGAGHDLTGTVSAAAPVAPSTKPSQGEEGGAGANAGSVREEITAVLKVDASSAAETIALAAIGAKLLEVITEVAGGYPDLQEWISSDDPAGIVRELAEENAVLKDLAAARSQQSSADEKRAFVVSRSVRVNGEFFAAGVRELTEKQHAAVAAANRCDPDWENGE
ncbi:hypothetical protein [Agrobacterium sp.]|uniref:hypothetical protein n=1 Tax=Agrobacterium sp. TaxID=361 RepID=UPI0025BF77FF|nr:hypothetical protein [Agrobacterium sp.]MCD4663134.1 hypothetical protein [Agrobacterium sp.]